MSESVTENNEDAAMWVHIHGVLIQDGHLVARGTIPANKEETPCESTTSRISTKGLVLVFAVPSLVFLERAMMRVRATSNCIPYQCMNMK